MLLNCYLFTCQADCVTHMSTPNYKSYDINAKVHLMTIKVKLEHSKIIRLIIWVA